MAETPPQRNANFMSSKVQDRRRDPRVTTWSPLTISQNGQPVQANLRNLSIAGLACTTLKTLTPQSELEIELQLPEGSRRSKLLVQGVVVRCEPLQRPTPRKKFEVAIYFPGLPHRDREALQSFLDSRTEAPEKD